MPGTVTEQTNKLQYSDTRVTKESFEDGYKMGEKLVMWTRYNKRGIIHVALTAQYLGVRKDPVAYRVGIVTGYFAEAINMRRISESEALTLDDLGVLGVKVGETQPNK